MITKSWHVCVLIPARNEELLLQNCLTSVIAACQYLPNHISFDIVLTADFSTDRTEETAKESLGDLGAVLKISKANVGYARQVAATFALARYNGSLENCWLANTDADTTVPLTWLSDQITWANLGAHCIAGIVKVDSFSEHDQSVATKFTSHYELRPDGSHSHVHGANLGIRADVYNRIGGWNSLETGEDHDLWNRLSPHDIKISDSNLYVITSGRKIGRAPKGFADKLTSFNEETNE